MSSSDVENDGDIVVQQTSSDSGRPLLFITGGLALLAVLTLAIVLPIYFSNVDNVGADEEVTQFETAMEGIDAISGYVQVRDNAQMFWVLYYQDDSFKPPAFDPINPTPLIVWLQGGPGSASTGYGLFEEIGPLDLNLNRRATSWTGLAHILFIDQPVGTGYSYVTDDNSYATDVDMGGRDLLNLMKGFYSKFPEMRANPLYIFSQSYGAKFAVALAEQLVQEINSGAMAVNFKGVQLGSGYVSPEDSVLSWAEYLHHWSLLDHAGRSEVNTSALEVSTLIQNGQWKQAYDKKLETQELVSSLTDNVDVYNILYPHHPEIPGTDPYRDLMTVQFPAYFGNIPSDVVWGSQKDRVLENMIEDFMKPVSEKVDAVLDENIKVVVVNGMLDMLVSTPGQEAWVEKLAWSGSDSFHNLAWTPFLRLDNGDTAGFWKSFENFKFWWILDAGHSTAVDQADVMLRVLNNTCST